MMDAREPVYVRLAAGETVRRLEHAEPFKAVIVIEDDVTAEWRTAVSEWLVRSGGRYAMAWGLCCSAWDDSIDLANLRTFGHGEVLDQDFVMTTWHERESLKDVFWFAMHAAMHPVLVLDQTYIVHISAKARQEEMLDLFREAQKDEISAHEN